jgi:hypothetical protein
MATEPAKWEKITPDVLKPSIKHIREAYDDAEWKCGEITKRLCYAALHPLTGDQASLVPYVRAFTVYQRIIGPVADAEVQELLRIGSESAVFAAYSNAYRYGLVAEVRRLFNDVLQIALANSDILEDHSVEWAKEHFNILIDGKVNLVKGWIKDVCDEQDLSKPVDTAEDLEEFVFRKTWRAPRLIWMKPSGNCPYDPSTAWVREDEPMTERLVEGLSGRFIQLLGIDLDKIAGDAHLRLAKEGRPPQAPKRIATEEVTQEVPVSQPADAKEREVAGPALELGIQQARPLLESSTAARAGGLAQQAQSEQRARASESDALLLKYRSEVKRAILIQLAQNPRATDLEICRGLDADGSLELPQSWRGNSTDRGFFDAYSDISRRHNVEAAISKVRRDLREQGLLPKR